MVQYYRDDRYERGWGRDILQAALSLKEMKLRREEKEADREERRKDRLSTQYMQAKNIDLQKKLSEEETLRQEARNKVTDKYQTAIINNAAKTLEVTEKHQKSMEQIAYAQAVTNQINAQQTMANQEELIKTGRAKLAMEGSQNLMTMYDNIMKNTAAGEVPNLAPLYAAVGNVGNSLIKAGDIPGGLSLLASWNRTLDSALNTKKALSPAEAALNKQLENQILVQKMQGQQQTSTVGQTLEANKELKLMVTPSDYADMVKALSTNLTRMDSDSTEYSETVQKIKEYTNAFSNAVLGGGGYKKKLSSNDESGMNSILGN